MSKSKAVPAKRGKGNVRFFDPPNILRQKVGAGGIEPARIQRAEAYIDKNDIDFLPHAEAILLRLEKAIAKAKKAPKADEDVIETISGPIMEMKANGAMFGYALATEIAEVVLGFLEEVDELNEDSFTIIDVHQRTLEVIVKHKLKGIAGKEGKALAQELYNACARYRKKYGLDE